MIISFNKIRPLKYHRMYCCAMRKMGGYFIVYSHTFTIQQMTCTCQLKPLWVLFHAHFVQARHACETAKTLPYNLYIIHNMQLRTIMRLRETHLFTFAFILLCAITILNAFLFLEGAPIRPWDEARHGVSAYEMLQNNNWLINTYRQGVDTWNLKPPLGFWSVMLGYEIFGTNAFGFRAISALASILCVFMTYYFGRRLFSPWVGLGAAFLLVTSYTFVLNHNMRHGDPDAVYIFFTTLATFAVLLSEQKKTWLYLGALCLSLAFLTKSFHVGAIALPIVIVALCIHGKSLFRPRTFFLCLLCGLGPTLLWALCRYQADGMYFLGKMFMTDVWNRATTVIEDHGQPFWYYAEILFRDFGLPTLALCIPARIYLRKMHIKMRLQYIVKVFSQSPSPIKYLALCCLMAFCIFQASSSKLEWYLYPIEPFLALMVAFWAQRIFVLLQDVPMRTVTGHICIGIFLAVLTFQEIRIVVRIFQDRYKENPIQVALHEAAEKFNSAPIYLAQGHWTQDTVLAALLHGDFVAKDGGEQQWQQEKQGLLLLPDGTIKTHEQIKEK